MALWSAWFPDVMPHVEGCPYPVIEHELRRAAQLFFEGSRAWKVTLPVVTVAADTETVTLTMLDGQELVRIEKAWYDGVELDVYSADELETVVPGDWQTHTGTPAAIIQMEPGIVRLYPVPADDAVSGLKFIVSVKPSEASTGIPDNQLSKYRGDIAAGAKGRLMLYPKKPWSDTALGVAYGESFSGAIAKACVDAARAFGRGQIRSNPRWC